MRNVNIKKCLSKFYSSMRNVLSLKCGFAVFIYKGKISWLFVWRKGKFDMLLWCFRFLRQGKVLNYSVVFHIPQTPSSVQHSSLWHRAQVSNDSSGKSHWDKFPTIYLCRNGHNHSLFVMLNSCWPITVVVWSKAWIVLALSSTRVMGSNPTQGMYLCVCLFGVVLFCV
jgi:hypothetical protein